MYALMSEQGDFVVNPETGSQCSDLRMGVMCSYFRTLIRILAALFWMYCSFWMLFLGIPMRSTVVQPGGDKGVDKFFSIWQTECGAEFRNISQVVEGGLAYLFDVGLKVQVRIHLNSQIGNR